MLQKILSNIFLIGTLMIFGCEHKITPEKLFDLSKDKYLNSNNPDLIEKMRKSK